MLKIFIFLRQDHRASAVIHSHTHILYNIYNDFIWYGESFISSGECVINCKSYQIWRILYQEKGKCHQFQNCYQLQHPYLIWRIRLSGPHSWPFISDPFSVFFKSCLFKFNKNPFGFFQTNLKADDLWVPPICFWKQVFCETP